MHYYIKTKDWEHIFEILSKRKDIRTGNRSRLRLFIEAIWFMSRSGCQWRLLPERYGSWRAVHRRFKNWNDKGVWSDLFKSTTTDRDMKSIMIDSTIIRSHSCSAVYKKDSHEQECLGRSKGGFSTKIHAVVDALGNPLRFILSSGQSNDITQPESLIQNFNNRGISRIFVKRYGFDFILVLCHLTVFFLRLLKFVEYDSILFFRTQQSLTVRSSPYFYT